MRVIASLRVAATMIIGGITEIAQSAPSLFQHFPASGRT
jgi:hypothetical protein